MKKIEAKRLLEAVHPVKFNALEQIPLLSACKALGRLRNEVKNIEDDLQTIREQTKPDGVMEGTVLTEEQQVEWNKKLIPAAGVLMNEEVNLDVRILSEVEFCMVCKANPEMTAGQMMMLNEYMVKNE